MSPEDMSDSDKIAVLLDRSERIEKALLGNGRPGLIAEVATIVEKVDDLDKRAPSKKEKYGAIGGILAAMVLALWDKLPR